LATPRRGIRLRTVVPAQQVLREALLEALGPRLAALYAPA
jgi:hypothetical protein